MSHDVIQVIHKLRQHVEQPIKPNPRGTLNPANRLFHNPEAMHAHGGNMPIMPKTILSARVESKEKAQFITRLLQKMPKKISGYYFDVHFTPSQEGVPQIHLSVQGPRIAQIKEDIHAEWNRTPTPKKNPTC